MLSDNPREDAQFDALADILTDLRRVVGNLVNNPSLAVPKRHHDSLKLAWKEVETTLTETASAVRSQDPWEKLEETGLLDEQLEIKVELYLHARENLLHWGLARDGVLNEAFR